MEVTIRGRVVNASANLSLATNIGHVSQAGSVTKTFKNPGTRTFLTHFIAAGQLSAAGIANAVTSYSQTVPDPARADTLDDLALRAMPLA
ncbi:hypothetical protein [Nocardia miyunensis]|uniref:hypothetical protein n=1 Tax=Nocardia miyunensis TaxID=282684 RepID=UPI0012F477D8|nr:hypothetical protein [Nocardia miyunensis]